MPHAFLAGLGRVFFLIELSGVLRLAIVGLVLAGWWIGLGRLRMKGRARLGAWLAVAVPVAAWLAAVWSIAAAGGLTPRPGQAPPVLLFIAVPATLGLVAVTRWRRVGEVLDAIPPQWLVGLQSYRMFGTAFLVLWGLGRSPALTSVPAGVGDALTGALALVTAVLLARDPERGRGAALAWNVFGLADMLIGVGLTQYARLLAISAGLAPPQQPYPFIMIAAFMVPFGVILHGLSIWQLRRLGRRTGSAAPTFAKVAA